MDTKLIVTPKFKDICLNRKPVSTTHIRENEEHIDFKDIRLYMDTFRKQNLNFLEILFTDYFIIPSAYFDEWMRLVEHREEIARMNPCRAVQSMRGVALQKYYAMEHPYPSKIALLEKYGYDGKQVHHLLRVQDYLKRYIAGESYEACLKPSPEIIDRLIAYKRQEIPLDIARKEAAMAIDDVDHIALGFCTQVEEQEDENMRNLLEDVSCNIMKISYFIHFYHL